MSILYTLRRWIDRNAFEEERADVTRWQELILKSEPGGMGKPSERSLKKAEPVGTCRVCGLEVTKETWCPKCLAYTVK